MTKFKVALTSDVDYWKMRFRILASDEVAVEPIEIHRKSNFGVRMELSEIGKRKIQEK